MYIYLYLYGFDVFKIASSRDWSPRDISNGVLLMSTDETHFDMRPSKQGAAQEGPTDRPADNREFPLRQRMILWKWINLIR